MIRLWNCAPGSATAGSRSRFREGVATRMMPLVVVRDVGTATLPELQTRPARFLPSISWPTVGVPLAQREPSVSRRAGRRRKGGNILAAHPRGSHRASRGCPASSSGSRMTRIRIRPIFRAFPTRGHAARVPERAVRAGIRAPRRRPAARAGSCRRSIRGCPDPRRRRARSCSSRMGSPRVRAAGRSHPATLGLILKPSATGSSWTETG